MEASLVFRGQDVLGATTCPEGAGGPLTITQQNDGYVTLASLDAPNEHVSQGSGALAASRHALAFAAPVAALGGGAFAAALLTSAANDRGRNAATHGHPSLALLRGGAPVTTAALDAAAAQSPSPALRVPLPGPLHSLHVLRCGGGGAGGGSSAAVAVLQSGAVGCADFSQGELEQAEAAEGAALAAASAGAGLAVAVKRGAAAGGGGGVAVALYAAVAGPGAGAAAASSATLRRVPVALEQDGVGTEGETTDAEDDDGEHDDEDEPRQGGGGGNGRRRARRRASATAAGATDATPLGLLHLPAPRGGGAGPASAKRALVGLAYWPGAYVAALWEGGVVTMRPLTSGGGGGGGDGAAAATGSSSSGVAPVTAGPSAELLPGPFFGGGSASDAASAEVASRKRTKAAAASAGGGEAAAAAAYALAALGPAHLLLVRVGGGVARHAVIDARFGVALGCGSAELLGVPPTLDLHGPGGVQLLALGEGAGGGAAGSGDDAGGGRRHRRAAALVLGGQAAFALSFEVPPATLASMVGRLALAGVGARAGPGAEATAVVAVAAGSAAAAAAGGAAGADGLLVAASTRPLDVASVLSPEQRLAAAQDAAPCALRPAAGGLGANGGDEAGAAAAAAAAAAATAAAEDLLRAVEAFETSAAAAQAAQGGSNSKKKRQHQTDEAAADAVEEAALRAAALLSGAGGGASSAAAAAAGAPSPAAPRGRRSPAKASAASHAAAAAAPASTHATADWRMSPRLLGRAAAALAAAKRWAALGRLLSAQPPQTLLHCPRLLPALAAARQYDLIALVCASAEDVPAGAVVRAMCSVLAAAAGARARAAAARGGKGGNGNDRKQPQQAAWRARVRACAERVVRQAEARPADPAVRAAAWRAAAAVDGFSAEDVALHALAAAPADPLELAAALRRRLPSARAALRLVAYLGKWAARHARELPTASAPDALLGQLSNNAAGGAGAGASAAAAGGASAFPPEADERAAAAAAAGDADDDDDDFGAAGPLPARVLLLSPSYAQVLDLLRAVLDAQLTPLALLGEGAAPELRRLQRTVAGAAGAGASLARLKGAAEHLAAGAPLPDASLAAASNYTVELLDLRVAAAAAAPAGGGGSGVAGRASGGGGGGHGGHRSQRR